MLAAARSPRRHSVCLQVRHACPPCGTKKSLNRNCQSRLRRTSAQFGRPKRATRCVTGMMCCCSVSARGDAVASQRLGPSLCAWTAVKIMIARSSSSSDSSMHKFALCLGDCATNSNRVEPSSKMPLGLSSMRPAVPNELARRFYADAAACRDAEPWLNDPRSRCVMEPFPHAVLFVAQDCVRALNASACCIGAPLLPAHHPWPIASRRGEAMALSVASQQARCVPCASSHTVVVVGQSC
jgi:hypothetical protein